MTIPAPLCEGKPAIRLVGDLAWVAQGRCAACHVRLDDRSACPECGASWRAGSGSDAVPWLEKRSWMRCQTWFIHGAMAALALDFLGVDAGTAVEWAGSAPSDERAPLAAASRWWLHARMISGRASQSCPFSVIHWRWAFLQAISLSA